MKRKDLIALIGACTCAIGLMLIAFPAPSVNAEEPPREGCAAVSKQEYNSANRQKLLHSRFSTYAYSIEVAAESALKKFKISLLIGRSGGGLSVIESPTAIMLCHSIRKLSPSLFHAPGALFG
jgi:hypothetical protein